LILREENRIKVFENRMLRRIFGGKVKEGIAVPVTDREGP
jgi:hypothetical protein